MIPDSVLNIEQSLMRARWVFPEVDPDHVARICRTHDVPEMVAHLLAARNVAAEDVSGFLQPTLRDNFPDPFSMAGMEALAEALADAIEGGRRLAVFGDFDVDGATSSAVLCRFFRHFGLEVPFYIPDRLTEGYGPNTEAFRKLKQDGAELVILADCGTTAFDTIAAAREMGLEVAILDHHEAEARLPEANHLVNPKRQDDTSGLDMLAACGVAFMVCVAINAKLRERGYFTKNGVAEAPLKNWLDVIALGTVCDMVPLTGVNRLFVRTGFSLMANTLNPGLNALMEVSRVSGKPSPYHAGFVLGPRINAGSRVHQADLGARLLVTDDAEEARNIAFTLEDCNGKRKEIQAQMVAEATGMVEAGGLDQHPAILVSGEEWHPGLSGLVAGRLREKYGRPSVVVTFAEGMDGTLEGRGSGRSVPGVSIAQAFIDARNEGILLKGGGHAMAGGFTIAPERIEDFRTYLYEHIAAQTGSDEPSVESLIDGVLTVSGAGTGLVNMIHDQFGPFGQEHPEPLFVFPSVRVHSADIVGDGHVRAMISDWEGGPRIKAMAFRAADTPLGQALLKNGRQPMHLAGALKIDTWSGTEKVEIHIQDGAFVIGQAEAGEKKSATQPLA